MVHLGEPHLALHPHSHKQGQSQLVPQQSQLHLVLYTGYTGALAVFLNLNRGWAQGCALW